MWFLEQSCNGRFFEGPAIGLPYSLLEYNFSYTRCYHLYRVNLRTWHWRPALHYKTSGLEQIKNKVDSSQQEIC